MKINLIWAQNEAGLIGRAGGLPWHIPEDLAHFREVTRGKSVIMGRATWDSLPEKFRPLPGRTNIVITRNTAWDAAGAVVVHSIDQAVSAADTEEVWVIGGGEIYRQFLTRADRAAITVVAAPEAQGDTYAPELGPQWERVSRDPELGWHLAKSNIPYRFESHARISLNER
ncbi:MAG TPA: dihydrofolate reductase [Actinomycetales bacterium]|nr:dihydrofolate reductase [Actinomycetales bacterium]